MGNKSSVQSKVGQKTWRCLPCALGFSRELLNGGLGEPRTILFRARLDDCPRRLEACAVLWEKSDPGKADPERSADRIPSHELQKWTS